MATTTNRYQILQWTPFPGKYEPMPEWQLQQAEYNLKVNKTHYYEHAAGTGNRILYPPEIARQIVTYWQKRWPFAKYRLKRTQSYDRTKKPI